MCNLTLRMKGGSVPLCAILLTICFQFLLVSNVSSQAIACNNLVQVSLNEDCEATITPDMILEGSPPNSDTDYLVTLNGVTAPTVDIYTEGLFAVTVTYIPTGNSCWGEILVQDKLAPQIIAGNCGFGTPVSGSFDDSDVVGPATPLTTFGPTGGACDMLLNMAFPGQPIPPPNGFFVRSIPLTLDHDGTYVFVPNVSTAQNCNMVFYLIPEGTFDPNDPCDGFIAPGGVGNTPGSVTPGSDYILAGDYELLVCQGPDNAPCSFTINMTSDVCEYPCVDLSTFQGGFSIPPIVEENCGIYDCNYSDNLMADQCGTTVLARTWICVDDSDNSSEPYTQSLIFNPIDLNEIVPPAPTVDLSCGVGYDPESIVDYLFDQTGDRPFAEHSAYPTFNGSPIRNGLVCNIAATYTDQLVPICAPGCGDNNKIFRTWNIYDWCSGTSVQYIQLIKASDTEKPTIIFTSNNTLTVSVDPWGCYATVNLPAPDILHDNCDSNVSYTITAEAPITVVGNTASGLPLGDHEFTYTAEDCCGNFEQATLTITVVDETAPVAVATQNIVVTLTSGGGDGIAKLYAPSVDNGSHDGCGPVFFEVRRDTDLCGIVGNATYNNDGHTFDAFNDPDNGEFVKFCCEDIYGPNGVDIDGDGINDYGIVQVWLRVFDFNGNFNETWADVRVEDKLAPAIICPPNIEVDCTDPIDDLGITGEATAYNACNNAQVDYIDLGDIDNCGLGQITRRWFVVGRSDIFCDQLITKSSYTPFNGNTIQWPGDIDTDCQNLGFTGIPTYATGACDLVAYSMRSDTFLFETGACLKILNEFTVIDWCQYDPNNSSSGGGIWTHTQVIKVNDDEQPILADCEDKVFPASDAADADNDGNVCEGRNVMLTNSASDLGVCASPWLKWEVEVDLWGDYITEYTYSSTLAPSHPFYIAPTTNGQEVKITLPDVDASMSNHRIVWKVSDGCGNATSCVTNFMITDNVPPTPYCVNLSTALMEAGTVELWACDFDLGAWDNCSDQDDLRFTFSSTSPDADPNYIPSLKCSSRQFTCNDLPSTPGEPITLEVYVWDEKDNFESCTVELTLVDNQNACNTNTVLTAAISGRIAMENGEPMSDVDVELMTDGVIGFPLVLNTNYDGIYSFNDNPMYLDYEVTSQKNDDAMNGVSTLDLVLIQKHILDIQSLTSAYKVIAADVNKDDKITAIDLIELRKMILGLYNEFPNNTSWRFVDSHQNFLDDMHPFPVSEKVQVTSLDHDMMEEGMVAIKVGDVNENAVGNATGNVVSSRSGDLQFVIQDQEVVAGTLVSVPVRAMDFDRVSGFQFTLEAEGLVLSQVTSGAISMTDANVAQIGTALTSSWNEVHPTSVDNDAVMFTLNFAATESGKLNEMLHISDRITTAEAYLSDGAEIKGLDLEFRTEEGLVETGYQLFQNEPNPFADQTIIGFKLPSASSATLSIYNISGQVIKTITADYQKGYNEVAISRDELDATGVIYYQLESGQYVAAKKMIVIK